MALKIVKTLIINGETITIEGTPEEVEQYENTLKKKEQKAEGAKRKKELLKDEVKRLVKEEVDAIPKETHHWHWYYTQPFISQYKYQCPWCGKFGCNDTHVTYTSGNCTVSNEKSYTVSSTSNNILLRS